LNAHRAGASLLTRLPGGLEKKKQEFRFEREKIKNTTRNGDPVKKGSGGGVRSGGFLGSNLPRMRIRTEVFSPEKERPAWIRKKLTRGKINLSSEGEGNEQKRGKGQPGGRDVGRGDA